MEIIEYSSQYEEEIKDMFVELQEYIASIDREKYNILTEEYREKCFEKAMSEVEKYNGKIFLAIENNTVVGVITGVIHNEEESTYEFKAPKRGKVLDLIVSKKNRSQGIGTMLLEYMETYFKSIGCKGVLLDVFAYNFAAKELYKKLGYFDRTIEMMKQL